MDYSNDPRAWTGRVDRIVAAAAPVQGTPVYKVGRTTGRTDGIINRACVNVASDDVFLLCQSGATYYAQGGDSGGPVLGYAGVLGSVVLFGIHNGDGGVFSSIGYIVNELGPLDFFPGTDAGASVPEPANR